MKKVLLIAAAALFIGSTASAQDGDVYKQTGGEKNFEVLFAPLGGSPIGLDGIKYRNFTSTNTAFRVAVFVGFNTNTDVSIGFGGGNGEGGSEKELKTITSDFDISIRPGLEYHLNGTDRISPYYGFEGVISFGTSSKKEDQVIENDIKRLKTNSEGAFGVGANAFAGVDFYIANNLYIGAEFGLGIFFESDMKSKSEYWNGSKIDVAEAPGGSSLSFGPNVVSALRLGLLF